MGYYPIYQRSDMPAPEVPFNKITHLAIGGVTPQADGSISTAPFTDNTTWAAVVPDLVTRAHNAGRKVILMVGGASSSGGFVPASNATNRTTFVTNLLAFAHQYNLDGIDLDWEPLQTTDLPSLEELAKAIRLAWPTVILTAPVDFININYQTVDPSWARIAMQFDQINIMTYGMAGAYSGWQSWHHSPLYGQTATTPTSIDTSVTAWLTAGVPASKLGVGAGFYGLCYTSPVTAPKQNLGSSTVSADDNTLAYRIIMSGYYSAPARQWDTQAMVPYLSFASPTGTKQCTYLSYTDAESLAAVASYIKAHQLGGIIIWTINEGHLASVTDKDPLISALSTGLQ
ncbi:MAG TPA: glycoside hydrolase family 18 protein [Steroidobacteraceae bacterium]|nr:glycoside hydrolase family 18 protein [Steroidobacteraceae bacterium]